MGSPENPKPSPGSSPSQRPFRDSLIDRFDQLLVAGTAILFTVGIGVTLLNLGYPVMQPVFHPALFEVGVKSVQLAGILASTCLIERGGRATVGKLYRFISNL